MERIGTPNRVSALFGVTNPPAIMPSLLSAFSPAPLLTVLCGGPPGAISVEFLLGARLFTREPPTPGKLRPSHYMDAALLAEIESGRGVRDDGSGRSQAKSSSSSSSGFEGRRY
ncbi:MAG: hypothetical protein CME06_10055 [Gemmatimonadetes bacterium]|nr:hypothetical protein [Gemmatimonadota bacterium]